MKQSETRIIKRSQITFAAYNPRKESKKVIDALKKNFKRVGYLGGVVWNEASGNLVSGHKRVQTMDVVFGYPGSDYDIKVEVVQMDEKTEKEQNIFMNAADSQGEFDNFKLADMLHEISAEFTGLSDETIELIKIEVPTFSFGDNSEQMEEIKTLKNRGLSDEELHEKRQAKQAERKQMAIEKDEERFQKNYLIITFDNFEDKSFACEQLGIDPYARYVPGIKVFKDLF